MADPVATAAMQGALLEGTPHEYVENAIKTGVGYNLKQYYQYATRRFRKRNCEWSFAILRSNGSYEYGLNDDRLLTVIPSLKAQPFKIVYDVDAFSKSGSKTFQTIAEKYNWDDFSTPLADGTRVIVNGVEDPKLHFEDNIDWGTSVVIGTEISRNVPAIILDPDVDPSSITKPHYVVAVDKFTPEESAGLIYWTSSKGFVPEGRPKNQRYETHFNPDPDFLKSLGLLDISTDPPTKILNTPVETNRTSSWKDEYITNSYIDSSNIPDKIKPPPKEDLNDTTEKVTIYYAQLERSALNFYRIRYWEQDGTIEYDQENYVWVTEDGKESHVGLKKYFLTNYKPLVDVSSRAKKEHWFKLYPYLPIREHDQNLMDFSKAKKYIDAIKKEEEVDDDSDATDREKARERTRTSKIISNKARHQRKIKTKTILDIKKSDGRHLVKMGDYLNTDYKQLGATIQASENEEDIYHSSILPAVTLGSNYDEVNDYWWAFFKNLHKRLGDGTYLNFIDAVNKLPDNCTFDDVLKLPRIELTYGMKGHGQFGGFINFAFIRRFTLNGRIKQVKRKRNVKEITLGLHADLLELTGDNLKELLKEPSKTMVKTEYFKTTHTQREYNCGTDESNYQLDVSALKPASRNPNRRTNGLGGFWFSTLNRGAKERIIRQDSDKAELMFSNFGYTFVCKPIGNGQLDVIAIAGLIGGQTRTGYVAHDRYSKRLDGRVVACRAHQELRMLWLRNYKKYIEKVPSNKIDVQIVFSAGSSRRKLESRFNSLFIIPLDYRVVSRMSGVALMRFTNRACLMMNWAITEVKQMRGIFTTLIKVIGIVITVVSAIMNPTAAMTWQQILKQVLIAAVTQAVINVGVKLLVKLLGNKGFMALLVAIIVITVAVSIGGQMDLASLPYANQLPSNQLASRLGQTSIEKGFFDSLVDGIKNSIQKTIQDWVNPNNLFKNVSTAVNKGSEIMGKYYQSQMKEVQERMERMTAEYERHMQELEELQEENEARAAPYSVKEAMAAIANKTKILGLEEFMTTSLLADNTLASEDYLAGFIEQKLNIEPDTFDSIGSIDFSLENKKEE